MLPLSSDFNSFTLVELQKRQFFDKNLEIFLGNLACSNLPGARRSAHGARRTRMLLFGSLHLGDLLLYFKIQMLPTNGNGVGIRVGSQI